MDDADALGVIAEIGIAVAGFAGVVAALRAPDGRLGSYTAFRVGVLLGMSAAVVVLSLFPIALLQGGLADSMVWVVASAVMGLVVFSVFIVAVPLAFKRTLWPSEAAESPAGTRWVRPLAFTWMGMVVMLQIANVASIGELWPYYAGLVAITAYSMFQFAWILLAPARSEAQP